MDREKEHDLQMVPHITFEAAQMRNGIREERLHKLIVLVVVLLAVCATISGVLLYIVHTNDVKKIEENNQKWLDYLAQYDFTDYSYSQDGRGLNIMGDGNGVEYYGTTPESTDTHSEEQ